MNRLSSLPVGLLVVVALLLATGCATPPPSPPRTGTAPVPAASSSRSAPAPKVKSEPSDDPLARELLQKAVEAMGGAAVIDRVQTLILTGKIQQRSALGKYDATATTTFLYPARMRRDVVLPAGNTISAIFTPDGAWLTGAAGAIELPEAEKEKLEAAAMRNPVSLLRARQDPLFRASTGGRLLPETPGDLLIIRIGSAETQLFLNAEGRIVQVSYVGTNPVDASKKEWLRVQYSDFRATDGLTYPFSSETFSREEKVSSFRLDSLRVNQPVAPGLFERPGPSPVSTPTPAPR
jgi:hypothetical protein